MRAAGRRTPLPRSRVFRRLAIVGWERGPAGYAVTDPHGFQSGYYSGSPDPIQNIPGSGACADEIDDAITGEAGSLAGSPVQTVMINSPAAGTFQFSLTGTAAGQLSLDIATEASDGSIQSFSVSGSAAIGSTTTYGLAYTSAPGGTKITTINGAAVSACDVNYDGSVNVSDVQSIVIEALGLSAAVNDLDSDGVVNVVDVQIAVNAALGLSCAAQ
jgi:hypothetical protein